MSQAFLIFEFGTNEEAAQRARHRLEGWRQGFRLGDKLQLWFDRAELEVDASAAGDKKALTEKNAEKHGKKDAGKEHAAEKHPHAKQHAHAEKQAEKSPAAKSHEEKEKAAEEAPASVRLYIRLGFSNHEKLSYQRWIERIPSEEPFKDFQPAIVTAGSDAFQSTEELFESFKQGEGARQRQR
jgi:hypothetical protein